MLLRSVAILTIFTALTTGADGADPQRWALLVGVDDYVSLQDLRFCGHDASALSDALRRSGFDDRRLFLLHDGATESRYRPFKANVEKQLDIVLNLAGPDDLVIVSFSGHGIHIDGKSYLCPNEAEDTRPDETMIAVDDVYKKFGECRAALKLLLVDACRNDPRPAGRKSAKPAEDRQSFGAVFDRPPEGIVVLASCAPGQISWEDEGLKHGVFMHHILRGLAGDADGNRNGRVTLGELYDFASNETKVYVANHFREIQVPAQRGEINGVFELPQSAPPKAFSNSLGMQFALLPAGKFTMGSPDGEPGRQVDEFPHEVRISRPFYMGVYEVTRGQFDQFVRAENYRTESERTGAGGWGVNLETNQFEGPNLKYSWRSPGFTQADDHPVVNVSWNDAQAFCAFLSRKEGRNYRLPTEAEWEYACRAGKQTAYEHGRDPEGLAQVGNTADQSFKARQPSGLNYGINGFDNCVFTSPVGRFKPNAFGLYDLAGNVNEWCLDRYAADYYLRSPASDPLGPAEGEHGVVRGGSWSLPESYARAARRNGIALNACNDGIGFRVVVVP
jgi:formylglycine-generating enzyme required for sulfatase activity